MGKNFAPRQIKIIDLKEEENFVEQYVKLRNSYSELLLSSTVNISETKVWLKRENIEIRGITQNNILLGVVILYLNRDGEIAFFVKNPNEKIGSKLLKIIEEVAEERNLKFIWAWVLKENLIAQHVFEKSGFVRERISKREYKGLLKIGFIYKKVMSDYRKF